MQSSNYKLFGVFCLAASCMVFSASQSQGAVGETFMEDEDSVFKFTVLTEEGSTGTVEVGRSVGAGYNISGNITIPSSATHNGITYRVTAIAADGFRSRNKLVSVTIPDSVTTIGKSAFSNCSGLQSIEIPDSVTSIGSSAFYGCESMSRIEIPGSVTVLQLMLFWKCTGLTDVVIGNGVTTIGESAFSFCESLTHLTIPDSVTDIGRAAFNYCALESIVIPASVNTLGRGAFDDCKNLTSVYFEGNVPDTGYNTIYWGTPETLLTYYPTGNATWEAEIVDGMWKNRKVANWTPAPPQPEDPPKIEYIVSNKELILNFTGELYESDDAVNWTKVESAVSPYKVKIGDRKQFFCFKEGSSVPEDQVLPGENAVISLPGNVDLDMIWIKPGTFMMGSPKNELGRENNETQHQVTLTKGYWLGKYEVTQAQYKAVTGTNPSWDKGADLPVEQVTWNDAMKFCSKLTDIEREAGRLPEGYEYTLPTEAQWEYACRAGTTTALNSGKNLSDEYQCPEMDEVGWYWYNGGKESYNNNLICTHSGGQKKPNAWGLYDMHGNVGEWCLDWYEDYPTTAVVDPTGPDTGTDRAVRWGSWWNAAWACRSAYRGNDKPDAVYASLGFRVALAPVVISDDGDMTIPISGDVNLAMVWIEPGTFMMGSPENERGRENYETQHEVTLTQGYWLGKYEVTQKQYQAIMGKNPSKFQGATLPVEKVSWEDAMAFCAKLTASEREAGRLPAGYEYTLPTEAQWEYACRAETTTALNSGKNLSNISQCTEMNEVGWYGGNSGNMTHSVGQKKPNAWGLYDMHGNVLEWCLDWNGSYPLAPEVDPKGPNNGTSRVIRGGGWNLIAGSCRSASRSNYGPTYSSYFCGFRVALSSVQAIDKDIRIPLSDTVNLDMIWIEPGSFMMGSPEGEKGRDAEETQHRVILTQGYWLGKFEVTQGQYKAIMGSNPSYYGGDEKPVEQVRWETAMEFCAKLTEIEKAAGRLPDGYKYTLPTEAQWEYACRAGTTTALNSGKNLSNSSQCSEVEEVAWYFFSGAGMTSVVGQKQPNAWGLYDMHGNVKEWCLDWYNENYYQSSPSEDPTGPAAPIDYDYNNYKVVRGGGWATYAYDCRSASRGKYYEDRYDRYTGFRVALVPEK